MSDIELIKVIGLLPTLPTNWLKIATTGVIQLDWGDHIK